MTPERLEALSPTERTVWVARSVDNLDISQAAGHGVLNVIFGNGISPLDVPAQLRIIEDVVMPVYSSKDMILLAGPDMMLVVLTTMVVNKFGRANFLVFNRQTQSYVERWAP